MSDQTLTNKQFATALANIVSTNVAAADLDDRPIIVTVARADYLRPSSLVIEFRGSPARFPIFYGGLCAHRLSRQLLVNGKRLKPGGKTLERAGRFIEAFLRTRSLWPADAFDGTHDDLSAFARWIERA